MRVTEIIAEATTRAYAKSGASQSLKFRCTGGPRKGQVRASPAACNAPIKVKSRITLQKNKQKMGGHGRYMAQKTKRTDNASRRLANLNKPRRRKAR